MGLKQNIHDLVDALPEDSPLLKEVGEALRLNRAIAVQYSTISSRSLQVTETNHFPSKMPARKFISPANQ
jgi:hypothetical protein